MRQLHDRRACFWAGKPVKFLVFAAQVILSPEYDSVNAPDHRKISTNFAKWRFS
jgi:hypothetical protein